MPWRIGGTSALSHSTATATGTDVEDDQVFNAGANSGILTVNYDMLGQPDDMRVFYGDTNIAAGTGVLIFDTGPDRTVDSNWE